MIRAAPGRPASVSALMTVSANPGSSSWRPDTLTDVDIWCSRYQRRASRQAVRSAQAPMGRMMPVPSAIRDELRRRDQRPAVRAPPHQGLHRPDLARLQVDDRLVVQQELVVGEGMSQPGAELGVVQARGAQLGPEHHDSVLAGLLRCVQRQIRVAQHVRRGWSGRTQVGGEYADAGGEEQLPPADRVGPPHRGQQDLRPLPGRAGFRVLQQYHEFVPAQPGQGRIGRGVVDQAPGHLDEDLSPGGGPGCR